MTPTHALSTLILLLLTFLPLSAQVLSATQVQLADSADFYIRHERWTDAERVIVKALRHDPANRTNYLLWSNLGTVRTQLNNLDGAIEAFSIGLASAPRSTTLLTGRARTLLLKADTDAALADLDAALAVDSTLQWPRKMRGLILTDRGSLDSALADFDNYTARFGDDADILNARAGIAATRGDAPLAIELYKKAYAREPDTEMLERALTIACQYGRLEEMSDELADALRRAPRSGNLYLMRAMLRRAMHQNSEMEADLRRALDLGADPDLYRLLTR